MNKKIFRRSVYGLTVLLIVWTALTFYAEYTGPQKRKTQGNFPAAKTALIVYNPDPFYNLDEQVCTGFAEGLSAFGFGSVIATLPDLQYEAANYDLFVFCANTYNWSPDWRITKFIRHYPALENKSVVAITLGAGSTTRSKRRLDNLVHSKHANLVASATYWLWRPNDKGRLKEKNSQVAVSEAKAFGYQVGEQLNSSLTIKNRNPVLLQKPGCFRENLLPM